MDVSDAALDHLRQVAALPDLPRVTLDVAGDGADRGLCEAEARRLGVADRVRFHGWVDRGTVNRLYEQADALIFPSFREPSGEFAVGDGTPGPRTLALRADLVDLQFGRTPDPRGWRVPVA